MDILDRLSSSKFRTTFKLKQQDFEYIEKVGIKTIEKHAKDFIINRISKKNIPNDGRQTPMKWHPVFVAMHATATCCRCCLYKWHRIEKNKELNENEIMYIVKIIMSWINKQLEVKQ